MEHKQKTQRQAFPVVTHGFVNRVRTQPDRAVFHYKEGGSEWKSLSWKDYFNTAREISAGLTQLGLKKGENVCIMSNTRLEWILCDISVMGTLGVAVPIYASNTAEDTAYIINHCEARFIFVEDQKQLEKILSVRDQLPKLEKIIPFSFQGRPDNAQRDEVLSLSALRELGKRALSQKTIAEDQYEKNLLAVKKEDVFTICYTSGTTGVPKGVVLSHDSMMSILEDVDKVFGHRVGEDEHLLCFLPASHIFGRVESMAVYHFGWNVHFAESIEKLFLNISEVRPTALFAVPRIFEKAYNRIKAGVDDSSPVKRLMFDWAFKAGSAYFTKKWAGETPSLRQFAEYMIADRVVFSKIFKKFGGRLQFCVAGGAPLPRAIGEFMCIVGIPIYEGYGLTETCAPVTLNTPEFVKFGAIGKPLPEVSIRIADDGEILVKSRKVFIGYYKNKEATDEVLKDGWFHTGDIGIIDDEGYVKITDRKKDLIVTSAGKNIAPQKIENLLKTYKHLSQIMIHGDRRNFLTALVVLEKEEVIKYAKEHHILFSAYEELLKNPKVVALVQRIFDEVNAGLASYETVKRFTILPNEFTVDSGELTPSLKVRRRFCMEKYKQELDSMYGGSV